MRITRCLAVTVLLACVSDAQVGPDQSYMLVYQAQMCRSPFAAETIMTATTSGQWSYAQDCPKQIQIEYFPSLDRAIEKLNARTIWIATMTEPSIKNEDFIGLFKVKRIPVSIQPSGKKTKVIEQVPQEFERDILEWKVQP